MDIADLMDNPVLMWLVPWLLAVLAWSAFFRANRNARLERRVWVVSNILLVLMFVVSYVATTRSLDLAAAALILTTVILCVNLRCTNFCDQCGATVHRQAPWRPVVNCPTCGDALRP